LSQASANSGDPLGTRSRQHLDRPREGLVTPTPERGAGYENAWFISLRCPQRRRDQDASCSVYLAGSPALAFALLALVAASSGLAVAATSSSGPVIRACAKKKGGALRLASKCRRSERAVSWSQAGPRGLQGLRGLTGAAGAAGATGPQGGAGLTTEVLPSGRTVRGWFNCDTVATVTNQIQGGSISFGLSLPSAPAVQVIAPKGAPTAQCPGSLAKPAAAPGNFCLYENSIENVSEFAIGNTAGEFPDADPFGAEVFVGSTATGRFFVDGSWAATAA
jgi:hypothetical protein